MSKENILFKFLENIQIWENELDRYTLDSLIKQPINGGWSLGQVYIHLIDATLKFHLAQVSECLFDNANSSASKNFKGFIVFNLLKKFPPIQIKVPASETYTPNQPKSLEEIKLGLQKVRDEMNTISHQVIANKCKGKTLHPGFNWLNSKEWFLLVGMHFQHHLNQKKRLDQMFNNN